jgi:hypothetical protein
MPFAGQCLEAGVSLTTEKTNRYEKSISVQEVREVLALGPDDPGFDTHIHWF